MTYRIAILAGLLAMGAASPAMAYPYHHYHHAYYYGYGPGYYYEEPYYYYPAPPAYVVPPSYSYNAPPPPAAQPLLQGPQEYADESYCREYTSHISVQGRTRPTYGTACLQPDGSWKIMN